MGLFRLYDFGISLYVISIRLASVFHPKAAQWVAGRKNWPALLQDAIKEKFNSGKKRVWIHCASLGEFEQGRPLIEAIKREYPEVQILLSFFSPSGYEIRKNYPLSDYVCYLPADTPAQAKQFLDLVKPDVAIFVKYEFWLRLLNELQKRDVPTFLVSAIFRPGQLFFHPVGRLWLDALRSFKAIFVQDASSEILLRRFDILQVSRVGDTRVDRVLDVARAAEKNERLDIFSENVNLLIAGSTWLPDEQLLRGLMEHGFPADWKMVIAPHHIATENLNRLEGYFPGLTVRYSGANENLLREARVLLVDNIGMLAAIYRYGKIAYIGGGFGAGIHNILEPMAFGLPVIFGPRYQKFAEAQNMVEQGGAVVIHNIGQLRQAFGELRSNKYRSASEICHSYIHHHQGATNQIMVVLTKYLES